MRNAYLLVLLAADQLRTCVANLLTKLGGHATVEANTATAANRVLRARGIGGACARALGTSDRDVPTTRALATVAKRAATAEMRGDLITSRRYAEQVDRKVASLFKGGDTSVRVCPHS